MSAYPLRIGVVGCGNIAGPYAKTLKPYEQIEIVGASDIDPQRAVDYCAEYGGTPYGSLEELLADDRIDAVLNLTIHHAHPAVITQCLEAGKHVHTEKPLAMKYEDAKRLVALAEEKGLRLSSSPITFMGEAQQTAWKAIRDGRLGTVRVAYAEANWGRIESWHPAPGAFYQVGALYDVGVYPLTILTTIFGPARRASGFGKVVYPDRVTKEGVAFHIDTPDWLTAAVEFESGLVARLTTNFYVGHHSKQKGIEFHGDLGSLHIDSWQDFNAKVEFAEYHKPYEPLPYVKEPFPGIEWAQSIVELANAIGENRPQRATGTQAAHVVEILNAITTSVEGGGIVEITSSFTPPPPMEWAE
jgi:predicted dehydrogenase